jgi:uridine kinase
VIRASVDGFHNARALRYERGRHSPEGYFENSYNYAALNQYLLDPLTESRQFAGVSVRQFLMM